MTALHADLDLILLRTATRFPHLSTRAWSAARTALGLARAQTGGDAAAVRCVGLCVFVVEAYSRAISNGGRILPRSATFDAFVWLPRGPPFALAELTSHVKSLDTAFLHFAAFRDEFAARCELAGSAEAIGVDSVADVLRELDATSIATVRIVSSSSLIAASSTRAEINTCGDQMTAPAVAAACALISISPSASKLTLAVSSRGSALMLRSVRVSFADGGAAAAVGAFSSWATLNVHVPAARASALPSTILSLVIPQPCIGAVSVEVVIVK